MKLLPCPFCGEQPTTHKPKEVSKDLDLFLVGCSNDKCNVVHYLFPPDKWNNRPGEKDARVEGMEEIKETCMTIIETTINQYRLQYTFDEDYGHLSLVDNLCPPGATNIADGRREIELLIDAVRGEVLQLIKATR